MGKMLSRRDVGLISASLAAAFVLNPGLAFAQKAATPAPDYGTTPEIYRQAYVYAYPLVKNYLSIYQFAIDRTGGQYKGPPNQVNNVARVFTPADTGVITPNSDTPYSFLILDLRAEPIVVTLPRIDKNRYYSLQLVDLYTNNVDYIGTRRDGNGGGNFLLAGPDWKGDVPPGITRVVRFSTGMGFSQFRTKLFDPSDIDAVKKIQAGYRAVPLSSFLGKAPPPPAPRIAYPPIDDAGFDRDFWRYANFLLQFAPPIRGEEDLRARLAAAGIDGGKPWPPAGASAATLADIAAGSAAGRKDVETSLSRVTSSAGLFGTPEEMQGKYIERAVGAMGGIYGNSLEETLYPSYTADEQGLPYDASRNNYTLTFPAGQLPPVDAFWSVTMYDMKSQLLVDNPLDRYLINSPMLQRLSRNADGSITLYLQHASPGAAREANWLPAPNGPMGVVMRLYLPKQEVLSGAWKAPPIVRAGPAGK